MADTIDEGVFFGRRLFYLLVAISCIRQAEEHNSDMKRFLPKNISPLLVGIILKTINAVLEIIVGISLFFFIGAGRFIAHLVAKELIEDPYDPTANFIQHLLQGVFVHTELFVATYLIIHGLIKLAVITGIITKTRWAYPPAIIVLFLLVIYELYRYAFVTHSVFLVIFIIFDLAFIWLITNDYAKLRAKEQKK